jgi:hypothetical protein
MTNAVVPRPTITLTSAIENGQAEAPRIYHLRKSFAVVQFEETGRGRIVFLPEGADLRIVGPSRLDKCYEVVCDNQRYNIFKEDLLGPWSTPVRSSRNGPCEPRPWQRMPHRKASKSEQHGRTVYAQKPSIPGPKMREHEGPEGLNRESQAIDALSPGSAR